MNSVHHYSSLDERSEARLRLVSEFPLNISVVTYVAMNFVRHYSSFHERSDARLRLASWVVDVIIGEPEDPG